MDRWRGRGRRRRRFRWWAGVHKGVRRWWMGRMVGMVGYFDALLERE